MAFDQTTRNRLQKFVSSAREILSDEFTRQLQAVYGMDPQQGTVAELSSLKHLEDHQRQIAEQLRETFEHYLANTPGLSDKDRVKQVLDRIVREQAFTVLNRLAALRMAEARGFLIESIGNGQSSQGFQLYKYACETALGETGEAYSQYLFALFDEFALDLAVLFERDSPQGRLFPRDAALQELLNEINHTEIETLWAEDETIGWIYQYFNSQEERKKMRAESRAPRNSRELAVRNQFFTPRYVVEFLTDNTLGRIWYEMTQSNTALVDSCRYLVRRPTEIFLKSGETAPATEMSDNEALSHEEFLKQPVYIPYRPLKDPRSIRMLDPACGSMHFGLYAFDLFERIYLEAWQLEQRLGPDVFSREGDLQALQRTFDSLEAFKQQIPKLIIEHNIHGVDIDPRAVQIAGLSLWQRAQRAWQQQSIKPQQRPTIVKSNIVCAEPMPGEKVLLQEFTSKLNPPVLGQLLEVIFDKMQLAGEAGTLLKIEEEIQTAIHEAREQWIKQSGRNGINDMFQAELDAAIAQAKLGFDLRGIDDETFWDDAEQRILQALSDYADQAESGADQKRLFAEDAAKGFAFIDLCRKKFDVALMNPPFGEYSKNVKKYIESNYKSGKGDLYSSFIDRSTELIRDGLLGAITNRTGFFLDSFEIWRNQYIDGEKGYLHQFVDLGDKVLDALVETSCYVIGKKESRCDFFRLLDSSDKESDLVIAIDDRCQCKINPINYSKNLESFKHIPGSRLSYWASRKLINSFIKMNKLSDSGYSANVGLSTKDDFRYLRLIWEAPNNSISLDRNTCTSNKPWMPIAKGGDYKPYLSDIHLLCNWASNGKELDAYVSQKYPYLNGNTDWVLHPEVPYGRPGITYTRRTTAGFSPRLLPKGALISEKGATVYCDEIDLPVAQAFLQSRVFSFQIELCVAAGDSVTAGSPARSYETGIINSMPLPNNLDNDLLRTNIFQIWDALEKIDSINIQSMNFCSSIWRNIINEANSYTDMLYKFSEMTKLNLISAFESHESIEESISKSYSMDSESENNIAEVFGPNIYKFDKKIESFSLQNMQLLSIKELQKIAVDKYGYSRFTTKQVYRISHKIELISLILESHPVSILNSEYLDPINLIDTDDFSVNFLFYILSEIFESMWSSDNDSPGRFDVLNRLSRKKNFKSTSVIDTERLITLIENFDLGDERVFSNYFEGLSVSLGCKNMPHLIMTLLPELALSYFSRSRRQAPLYWPLQTSSSSYTLWLYYHQLNEQTLYICVNDFVEPKLQQVEKDLNSLRSKSARSTKEEKELEKLSDLARELLDFRDELLRLAKFWKPNLNDGVQITAAPLWKLFQQKAWQKKLKGTWESLEKGDYDWAHLACSIWPRRVLEKCHQDRSLAIAHDVEDIFWSEIEVPIIRRGRDTGETKLEWHPKDLSETELNSLIQNVITERDL